MPLSQIQIWGHSALVRIMTKQNDADPYSYGKATTIHFRVAYHAQLTRNSTGKPYQRYCMYTIFYLCAQFLRIQGFPEVLQLQAFYVCMSVANS
jgi:hypothetical protein